MYMRVSHPVSLSALHPPDRVKILGVVVVYLLAETAGFCQKDRSSSRGSSVEEKRRMVLQELTVCVQIGEHKRYARNDTEGRCEIMPPYMNEEGRTESRRSGSKRKK